MKKPADLLREQHMDFQPNMSCNIKKEFTSELVLFGLHEVYTLIIPLLRLN